MPDSLRIISIHQRLYRATHAVVSKRLVWIHLPSYVASKHRPFWLSDTLTNDDAGFKLQDYLPAPTNVLSSPR